MTLDVSKVRIFKDKNNYQVGILDYTLENEYIPSVVMNGTKKLPDKIIFYCCSYSYTSLIEQIKTCPVKPVYIEIRSLNDVIIHRFPKDRTTNDVGNIKMSTSLPSVFTQIKFQNFTKKKEYENSEVFFLIDELPGYSEVHRNNKIRLLDSEIKSMNISTRNKFKNIHLISSRKVVDSAKLFKSHIKSEYDISEPIQQMIEEYFGRVIHSKFVPLETTINFNDTSDILYSISTNESIVNPRTSGRIAFKGSSKNESGQIIFIGKNITELVKKTESIPITEMIVSNKYNISYLRYLLELVDITSVLPDNKVHYRTWFDNHKEYIFNYLINKSFKLDEKKDKISKCFNIIFNHYNTKLYDFIGNMKGTTTPITPPRQNRIHKKLFSVPYNSIRQDSVPDAYVNNNNDSGSDSDDTELL